MTVDAQVKTEEGSVGISEKPEQHSKGAVEGVQRNLTFGGALERFLFVGEKGSGGESAGEKGVGQKWAGRLRRPGGVGKRKSGEVDVDVDVDVVFEESKKVKMNMVKKEGVAAAARIVTSSSTAITRRNKSVATAAGLMSKKDTPSSSSSTLSFANQKITKATSTKPRKPPTTEPRAPRSPFSTKIPPEHLPTILAHPSPLMDILAPSLLLIFIGTNPGLLTAYTSHTYSSPSNSFWKLLHASGLTPTPTGVPLQATADRALPERFLLGNTNIVERASRSQEELSREEMCLGAGRTVERVRRWRPEAVCVVGKGVWEAFVAWGRRQRKMGGESGFRGVPRTGKGFEWGWQVDERGEEVRMGVGVGPGGVGGGEEPVPVPVPGRSWLPGKEAGETLPSPPLYDGPWEGARVYVVPGTSGLVTIPFARKLEIWREVGEWVGKRRGERGFVCS